MEEQLQLYNFAKRLDDVWDGMDTDEKLRKDTNGTIRLERRMNCKGCWGWGAIKMAPAIPLFSKTTPCLAAALHQVKVVHDSSVPWRKEIGLRLVGC